MTPDPENWKVIKQDVSEILENIFTVEEQEFMGDEHLDFLAEQIALGLDEQGY